MQAHTVALYHWTGELQSRACKAGLGVGWRRFYIVQKTMQAEKVAVADTKPTGKPPATTASASTPSAIKPSASRPLDERQERYAVDRDAPNSRDSACYVLHVVCCALQLSVGVKKTQRESFGKDVNGLWTASNDPSKSITISDGDVADGPKKCRIELTGPTPKGSSAPASRTVAVDWAPIDFNPKTLTVAYKGKSGVYELGVRPDGSAVLFYAPHTSIATSACSKVWNFVPFWAVPCRAVRGCGNGQYDFTVARDSKECVLCHAACYSWLRMLHVACGLLHAPVNLAGFRRAHA